MMTLSSTQGRAFEAIPAVAALEPPVRRTVLVTGGTGAIGSAVCRRMADLGHFVATTYLNEENARAWQGAMEREGYLFYLYKCDLGDPAGGLRLAGEVAHDLGPVQILVNVVGVRHDSGVRRISFADGSGAVASDMERLFGVTRALMGGMLASGFGRIVNISALNGQPGRLGPADYAAARAGMHALTTGLAREVAGRSITVNTVSPLHVEPEDVAHVVSFLTEDDSGFITGTDIAANGGYYVD